MRRTCVGGVVSVAVHASAIAAVLFAQSLFYEGPVTVIDFSLEKPALPEPKKDLPEKPRTPHVLSPPAVERRETFPDTTKPDTTRAADPDSIAPVSEQASASEVQGAGGVDSATLKKEYLTAQYGVIRDKVYRALTYPAYAQEEGWQGTVRMSFLVNCDGSVDSIQILRGSGHALLDNNAVKAVRFAAPFPRAPVRLQIIVPIDYRLE